VLKLAPDTRIFMAVAPIDMRKSFDGLRAAVQEVLEQNPLDGHLFLFHGKRSETAMAWRFGTSD
jgi:transposase